jgi:hypothetical protein
MDERERLRRLAVDNTSDLRLPMWSRRRWQAFAIAMGSPPVPLVECSYSLVHPEEVDARHQKEAKAA